MVLGFFRRRRRQAIRAQPFPRDWLGIVERNVPLFSRLPRHDQAAVLDDAKVLLAEKHFEGCGGLELTDEIRVTIAVQAARLLLHRVHDYFPRIRTILVYPQSVAHRQTTPLGDGVVEEADIGAAGLAAGREQAIVLSWEATLQGLATPDDGRDVVLHEFAHALDFEDHTFDGTPRHESVGAYRAWGRTMQDEFDAHRVALDADARTLIDAYGATNPAEFFAVLTELFFERPRALEETHPRLYEVMRDFYRQDPARQ